ncbi:MAG: hypothetical protein KF745_02755 [Phycisphaeraceae bacterium]|nr:hypothetical protein [Phycisphaeraceae bacterium]
MKADQVKKIADQALESLATALAAGKSEALTKYLAVLARFHKYSFGNVMLILWQRPEATHVAGFHTWKSLGRFVKKGEKGIAILAPMLIKPRDEDESNEGKSRPVLRFRGVHVFDVAQTEGAELPEPPQVAGDPGVHLERIKALVAERGITLDTEDLPMGADGVSRGGRISVRPGLPPAREFAVIVHELAHELLHRGEDRKEISKTVRETEAEAVAFVVSSAIGLETGTAASDYIQLYDGKTETLAASLDRIQKTAAEIIAKLISHADHDVRQAASSTTTVTPQC